MTDMRRVAGIFFAMCSALAGQPIREFLLEPRQATDLSVSGEVTAVTFPGAITAIAGADMLIDDGAKAAVEVDAGAPLRFQVTHAKGVNFLFVRTLDPAATGTLQVKFEGAAYVIQLRAVETARRPARSSNATPRRKRDG